MLSASWLAIGWSYADRGWRAVVDRAERFTHLAPGSAHGWQSQIRELIASRRTGYQDDGRKPQDGDPCVRQLRPSAAPNTGTRHNDTCCSRAGEPT